MAYTIPRAWKRLLRKKGTDIFYDDGIGNFYHIVNGTDKANAYIKRVEDDGGTVVDKEAATFDILKAVNEGYYDGATLLLPQGAGNKTAKLYAAKPVNGTGDFPLVRASKAFSIDDDGDFVENDNHVPSYVYKSGRPYLAVREQMTNLFRHNDPATSPGSPMNISAQITFAANDWDIGLNGIVGFDNSGSVIVQYYDPYAAATAGTYTFACIMRKADDTEPAIGISNDSVIDINILVGSVNINNADLKVKRNLGNGLWFVVGTVATSGSGSTGLRKRNAQSATILYASAIMLVSGDVDIELYDFIRTTGTTETRNADNYEVDLPAGTAKVTLTDIDDVETVDNSPADPYEIPVGLWKNIIMEE